MSTFAVVVIVVCVVALAVALTSYLRGTGALSQLGRSGNRWLDHQEDIDVSERPSEDDRDAPIPKRPLRGRPE